MSELKFIDNLIDHFELDPETEFVFVSKATVKNLDFEKLRQIAYVKGYIFESADSTNSICISNKVKRNNLVLYKAS